MILDLGGERLGVTDDPGAGDGEGLVRAADEVGADVSEGWWTVSIPSLDLDNVLNHLSLLHTGAELLLRPLRYILIDIRHSDVNINTAQKSIKETYW